MLTLSKALWAEIKSGSIEVQTRLQVRGRINKAQNSRKVLCSGEAISNNQNNTEAGRHASAPRETFYGQRGVKYSSSSAIPVTQIGY